VPVAPEETEAASSSSSRVPSAADAPPSFASSSDFFPNRLSKNPAQRTSRAWRLLGDRATRCVATTRAGAVTRARARRGARSAGARGATPTAPTAPRLAMAIACRLP